MTSSSARSSSLLFVLAMLCVSAVAAGFWSTPVEANTDPSCIAKEKEAGPCKTKPFGPTYYAPGCTTQKDKKNTQPKPGYIGAPCKENDGTAFNVGGKCVPGGKCKCDTCKADGDKGGMPMLPMLPMPMSMPKMDMPMMPMMQPCVPTSRTTTQNVATDTTPLLRTVTVNGVTMTSTTTRSTTTPVTTTVPDRDCLCQQNPWAEGCQASGSTGLLGSFGGSGGLFQNTAQGALDTLGSVANTVAGTVINGAANAIENLTGIDIDTGFTETNPTTVVVSPLTPGNTDTSYAQATYGATKQPTSTQPQYAYDDDTTQYGAFGGQEVEQTTLQAWTATLSNLLSQLGQALATLFGML